MASGPAYAPARANLSCGKDTMNVVTFAPHVRQHVRRSPRRRRNVESDATRGDFAPVTSGLPL